MKMINQHQIAPKEHLLEEKAVSCKNCMDQLHEVSQPFSETDIIWLQELFLTNDWHCLRLDDIHSGRSIINTMLYSLNYYHDVACLTMEEYPQLDSECCDLYLQLLEGGYLDGEPYDLEAFFLENFYADFLWIEETHELVKTPWYQQFLMVLHDLQMTHHMPVIVLSYK